MNCVKKGYEILGDRFLQRHRYHHDDSVSYLFRCHLFRYLFPSDSFNPISFVFVSYWYSFFGSCRSFTYHKKIKDGQKNRGNFEAVSSFPQTRCSYPIIWVTNNCSYVYLSTSGFHYVWGASLYRSICYSRLSFYTETKYFFSGGKHDHLRRYTYIQCTDLRSLVTLDGTTSLWILHT